MKAPVSVAGDAGIQPAEPIASTPRGTGDVEFAVGLAEHAAWKAAVPGGAKSQLARIAHSDTIVSRKELRTHE